MPSINRTTEKIEIKRVNNVFRYDVSESLIHIYNYKNIDCLVTENHNMIIRKSHSNGKLHQILANDIEEGKFQNIPLSGDCYSGIGLSESNEFCELLGWVIAKGSYWTEKYKCKNSKYKKEHIIEYKRVKIYQQKHSKYLAELLQMLGATFQIKLNGRYVEIEKPLAKKIRKYLPNKQRFGHLLFRMNKEQLESLFKGIVKGNALASNWKFYQSNINTINDFQTLCVLLGKASVFKKRKFYLEKNKKKTDYYVSIHQEKNTHDYIVHRVPYTGEVWCVENDNHTIFARRNGKVFITGNSYAPWRAFESAYIQNFTYGSSHPFECLTGNYYDRVIPNYIDPDDVMFCDKKENYLLFIGRVIKRKGIEVAYMTSQITGIPLVIAGGEGKIDKDGNLYNDFRIPPGNWEYIGSVDTKKRMTLMANAKAVLVPTLYLEPFGTVHIEAMLSGTPIITTSFGVFGGDTFQDGVHGFKCNTLDDFVFAANNVYKLNPYIIRKHAERFLTTNVRWEFQRWFDDLYQVYLSTTSKDIKGWHHIRNECPEWRKKCYNLE